MLYSRSFNLYKSKIRGKFPVIKWKNVTRKDYDIKNYALKSRDIS